MEATYYDAAGSAAGASFLAGLGLVWLISLAIVIVVLAAMWKVFTKAGQPGWAALIPIYNIYILTKIVGRPAWFVVGYFVPVVNVAILVIMFLDLALSFDKDTLFAIGLIFLSPIFMMILGFGDAVYTGPGAAKNPIIPQTL